ncbi:MAG: undecaprenyl-diphosphate phosphatase [Pirellulaceae bacterium]
MQWLHIVVLAVVQGVAEFLPVSSSGHLVILGALLGMQEESATVEIILHAGTLASILVIYRQRITALLWTDRRVIGLLAFGTFPAAVIGILIKTQAEWIIKSPLLAGCMLLVTGGMLLMLKHIPEGVQQYQRISYGKVVLIGCCQAFAILPGVSRSGSTIVGASLLGLKREDAVTLSFLLAIPAILGAVLLEARDLLEEGVSGERIGVLLLGAIVAFVVGIAALKWLIHWSRQGKLHLFAAWVIPLGVAVIGMWAAGIFEDATPADMSP